MRTLGLRLGTSVLGLSEPWRLYSLWGICGLWDLRQEAAPNTLRPGGKLCTHMWAWLCCSGRDEGSCVRAKFLKREEALGAVNRTRVNIMPAGRLFIAFEGVRLVARLTGGQAEPRP